MSLRISDLLAKALTVKQETVEEANSATRIGGLLEDIIRYIEMAISSIYDVTSEVPLPTGQYYTATTARAAVPESMRKLGLVISYNTTATQYTVEEFYKGNITDFTNPANWQNNTTEVLAALSELQSKLNLETTTRTTSILAIQNQLTGLAGGYLGAIAHNAAAPTPAASGYYEFNTAGSCAWITGGAVTVKIGDRVSVKYTAPSTYVYAYIAVDVTNTDLFNVTVKVPLTAGQFYTAATARAAVPTNIKKLGLKITYATSAGVWVEEQFVGGDVSGWPIVWAKGNESVNSSFSVNMLSSKPTFINTFENININLLEPLEIGRQYRLTLKMTSHLNNTNSSLFSIQINSPGFTQVWSQKEVYLYKQYEEIFTANAAYENLLLYCANFGGNIEVGCYKSVDTRTIDDNIASLNAEVQALNTELEALNTELEVLNTEVEATLADSYSEEERLVSPPTSVATFSNNHVLFDRDIEIGERIRISILLKSHLNNGTSTLFSIQSFRDSTYLQNIVSNQTVNLNQLYQIDYTNNSSKLTKLNFYCANFGGDVELHATTELVTPGKLNQLENRATKAYTNYSAILSSGETNTDKLYVNHETGNVYRYFNGFKAINSEQIPPLVGKKILWFGTSIPTGGNTIVNVDNYSGENKYPSMVAFKTGSTVYNESVGGTRISTGIPSAYNEINDPMGIGNNIQGSFGFYSALTHTLAEKDWIYDNWATIYTKFQDAGSLNATCPKTKEQLRDYSFERKLISKYLKSTATVSNVNLYVINHDFNDMFKIAMSGGDTIPTANSATERFYYAGAVNFLVRKIYAADAKARIVMITHYRKGEPDLDKMFNLVNTVAKSWSIPIIDVANNLQTAQSIQTAGYWDANKIWVETGYTFVNNGDGTYSTNDYGPQRSWNLSTYLTYANPHQVVSGEDINFIYPAGTWVRNEHRLNILCPDNVHPHSDLTGKANMMIAKIIIKEIEKYII